MRVVVEAEIKAQQEAEIGFYVFDRIDRLGHQMDIASRAFLSASEAMRRFGMSSQAFQKAWVRRV